MNEYTDVKVRVLFLLLSCFCITVLTVGCREDAADLLESPSRVVTLAPNLTEIVFAAGGGDRLVGVTTADDFPPEVNRIARVGAFPLNHEAVVGRNPDLVLATSHVHSEEDVEPLRQMGIPVRFLAFSTVDDIFSAIREVGGLIGSAQTADSVAGELADRWFTIGQSVPDESVRPTLLLVIGYDVLYSFGSESYTEAMIEAAGAASITADLQGQSSVLSDEFVLSSAPEIIVVTSDSAVSADQILAYHPSWDAVPAVASGRIYTIDPDLVLRPGPRVVDGTARLAEIVDRFEVRAD